MNSITPPTAPVPAVEKLDIRVLEDAFAGTTDREQFFFNIDFVCRIFPSSRSNRPAVLTLVAGMSKRMLALQRRGGGAALLAERPEAGPKRRLDPGLVALEGGPAARLGQLRLGDSMALIARTRLLPCFR